MKFISMAIMVEKVDKYFREYYSDTKFIDSEKEYAYANSMDVSDMSELNINLREGSMTFCKDLTDDNQSDYTHILKDKYNLFYAAKLS